MRRSPIVRVLLAGAVLVLLFAPLSQAFDRHDRFTPRDAELNLCALAVLATAGFWLARAAAARPLRPARTAPVSQRSPRSERRGPWLPVSPDISPPPPQRV
ncbi:MAG TPA: hypothetical protein VE996_04000 [Terriglobales bacterium]|nr:hypothetical protein [Terriglobales bacterium]